MRPSLPACIIFAIAVTTTLGARGPVAGLDTSTPYLIHYGNWDQAKVEFARDHYKLVILHPSGNITPRDIAAIRAGRDKKAGTDDDVLVLGYISVGEDARSGAPFVGDGEGPRVDPRNSPDDPLDDSIDPLGKPSPKGIGYASYYLDDTTPDGKPDRNPSFMGYYVNPGDPAWYEALQNMTKETDGYAGIREILSSDFGVGYGCDGLFLDTLDTPAPNSFGATKFEWTTKAYRDLVKRISDDNPEKLLLANRGLFYYNPNLPAYRYTLRPYINLLMFESYYTDSSGSGKPSLYFDDNKFNYAPKLNAEAQRVDGFTIIGLSYTTANESPQLVEGDFTEVQKEQGWLLARNNASIDGPFNTQAEEWNAEHEDQEPPQWDSTGATNQDRPQPRVGIQEAVAGKGEVALRWDVARDQTIPVRYNVYYTEGSELDFAKAVKLSAVITQVPENYQHGTGAGIYANEFTVKGLTEGKTYSFAVRAVDGKQQEEQNCVVLSATPNGNATSEPIQASHYASIKIDGEDTDWENIPQAVPTAPKSGTPNIAMVKIANDEQYLYVLVAYAEAVDTNLRNGAPSIFLSIDNDADTDTGFNLFQSDKIGAEISFQNDFPFAMSRENFNIEAEFDGEKLVEIAPYASHTRWQEYRIRRDGKYSVGGEAPRAIFPQDRIQLAVWSDAEGSESFAGTYHYRFAEKPPKSK